MSHKYSKETLWHFRCSECGGWWTIGDFEDGVLNTIFCPYCGEIEEYYELKEEDR